MKSAEAFAKATGQPFHLYYSLDCTGHGRKKKVLKNAAAEAAWIAPVKAAKNLSGHLPLIPGMPVFLTENIAPELGLCKGNPWSHHGSVTHALTRGNPKYIRDEILANRENLT